MFGVSRERVRQLKAEYPKGTKIVMISCDDPYKHIPSGTVGTVTMVDDAGQLHTDWEGYGSLAMIDGVDSWKKV